MHLAPCTLLFFFHGFIVFWQFTFMNKCLVKSMNMSCNLVQIDTTAKVVVLSLQLNFSYLPILPHEPDMYPHTHSTTTSRTWETAPLPQN